MCPKMGFRTNQIRRIHFYQLELLLKYIKLFTKIKAYGKLLKGTSVRLRCFHQILIQNENNAKEDKPNPKQRADVV